MSDCQSSLIPKQNILWHYQLYNSPRPLNYRLLNRCGETLLSYSSRLSFSSSSYSFCFLNLFCSIIFLQSPTINGYFFLQNSFRWDFLIYSFKPTLCTFHWSPCSWLRLEMRSWCFYHTNESTARGTCLPQKVSLTKGGQTVKMGHIAIEQKKTIPILGLCLDFYSGIEVKERCWLEKDHLWNQDTLKDLQRVRERM